MVVGLFRYPRDSSRTNPRMERGASYDGDRTQKVADRTCASEDHEGADKEGKQPALVEASTSSAAQKNNRRKKHRRLATNARENWQWPACEGWQW